MCPLVQPACTAARKPPSNNLATNGLHNVDLTVTIGDFACALDGTPLRPPQAQARARWRDLSVRLRATEEHPDPSWLELLYGPRTTVARRLARRRAAGEGDLRAAHGVTGAQVARMVLQVGGCGCVEAGGRGGPEGGARGQRSVHCAYGAAGGWVWVAITMCGLCGGRRARGT